MSTTTVPNGPDFTYLDRTNVLGILHRFNPALAEGYLYAVDCHELRDIAQLDDIAQRVFDYCVSIYLHENSKRKS